jgi:carbon monoxide dehydrogenase subunit G
MKIQNEFSILLPPAEAWRLLNDIPRVARCAPGAELIEQRNDGSFVGTISVRLGPVLLNFKGTVAYREVDERAYRVVAEAIGTETKARGTARADVVFSLLEALDGTRVVVDTDVQLAGSIAQYGRGAAVIQNTAQIIMDQFAKNLAQHLLNPESDVGVSAKPISGLSVLVKGITKSITG